MRYRATMKHPIINCSVTGCGKAPHKRGLCCAHYFQARKARKAGRRPVLGPLKPTTPYVRDTARFSLHLERDTYEDLVAFAKENRCTVVHAIRSILRSAFRDGLVIEL